MGFDNHRKQKIQIAEETPFDNTTNGFTADNVQEAIEETFVTASPGFTWGRSGTVTADTWLLNDSVPSNISGRSVFLSNAVIEKVYVANEDTTVFTLELYHHEGNENNLTLIDEVTTAAQRTNNFDVNFSVPTNKQLAIKIKSGSNSAKNIVVGVILKGSL